MEAVAKGEASGVATGDPRGRGEASGQTVAVATADPREPRGTGVPSGQRLPV